jgi:hypothetical protein
METSTVNRVPLALVPMRHLAEAKSEEDDWAGLKDHNERRKRQNRLNVRAHRKYDR